MFGRTVQVGSCGARRVAIAAVVAATAVSGCRHPESDASGAASASAAPSSRPPAPVASGTRVPAVQIQQAVNPDNLPPYSGATGKVHGIVTVSGDTAPTMDWWLAKIPAECSRARTVYAKLFREGMMRSLADALVSVTGYKGYVKPAADAVRVEASGCAWNTRMVALTFGQRIDVVSKDDQSYVPELIGTTMPAEMYAIPRGDAVPLYPTHPGRFLLSDGIHPTMFADVFVLKYATFAVTGLDGRYEIDGIPVGKVDVTALLPATLVTSAKSVVIEAGKDLELNFEIAYDAAKNPSMLPKQLEERAKAALIKGTPVPSAHTP